MLMMMFKVWFNAWCSWCIEGNLNLDDKCTLIRSLRVQCSDAAQGARTRHSRKLSYLKRSCTSEENSMFWKRVLE